MVSRSDILDELAMNRDHYKDIIQSLKFAKDKLLQQENDLFTEDIIAGYKTAITEAILEDLCDRLKSNVEDTWIILEDVDLVTFFEPNH